MYCIHARRDPGAGPGEIKLYVGCGYARLVWLGTGGSARSMRSLYYLLTVNDRRLIIRLDR